MVWDGHSNGHSPFLTCVFAVQAGEQKNVGINTLFEGLYRWGNLQSKSFVKWGTNGRVLHLCGENGL